MEYGSGTVHIRLGEFPRLGVGQIFITDTGEVHRLFERVPEAEVIDEVLKCRFHVLELLDGCFVVIGEFPARGHASAKIFIGEHECAIDEVAIYSY